MIRPCGGRVILLHYEPRSGWGDLHPQSLRPERSAFLLGHTLLFCQTLPSVKHAMHGSVRSLLHRSPHMAQTGKEACQAFCRSISFFSASTRTPSDR